eukprot:5635894-Heterocapsa_arctica.AAC.1
MYHLANYLYDGQLDNVYVSVNNLFHENYLHIGIEFIGVIWTLTTLVTTFLRCCAWSYRRTSSGTTDNVYQQRLCYVTTTGNKRLHINRDCV